MKTNDSVFDWRTLVFGLGLMLAWLGLIALGTLSAGGAL
jgi:hypothetical protein